jgi:hypothetical protein
MSCELQGDRSDEMGKRHAEQSRLMFPVQRHTVNVLRDSMAAGVNALNVVRSLPEAFACMGIEPFDCGAA